MARRRTRSLHYLRILSFKTLAPQNLNFKSGARVFFLNFLLSSHIQARRRRQSIRQSFAFNVHFTSTTITTSANYFAVKTFLFVFTFYISLSHIRLCLYLSLSVHVCVCARLHLSILLQVNRILCSTWVDFTWHCASCTFSEALNRLSYRLNLLLFCKQQSTIMCFFWLHVNDVTAVHFLNSKELRALPFFHVRIELCQSACLSYSCKKVTSESRVSWDQQLVSANGKLCRIDPAQCASFSCQAHNQCPLILNQFMEINVCICVFVYVFDGLFMPSSLAVRNVALICLALRHRRLCTYCWLPLFKMHSTLICFAVKCNIICYTYHCKCH